jgi:hypothetical protein
MRARLPSAQFSSMSLLAPICAKDEFADDALWADKPGGLPPLAVYTLTEQQDAADRVGPYRGSFLELARRISGEAREGTSQKAAVLGHASVAGTLRPRLHWLAVETIESPCATHRGMVNDGILLEHVLSRVLESSNGSGGMPSLPVAIP